MKKELFTDEEVYKIADFITDYNDKNLNSEHILDVYGIDVEHLNTREALDTYMNHLKSGNVDVKELWGADLYAVFCNHINNQGWLTWQWSTIIKTEIGRFDKNYNDNPLYKDTYSRMYNMDFEESEDGLFIRPIENLN